MIKELNRVYRLVSNIDTAGASLESPASPRRAQLMHRLLIGGGHCSPIHLLHTT